jgi:hypothetical protein
MSAQAYFDRIDALAEGADDERTQSVLEALYEWGEHLTSDLTA